MAKKKTIDVELLDDESSKFDDSLVSSILVTNSAAFGSFIPTLVGGMFAALFTNKPWKGVVAIATKLASRILKGIAWVIGKSRKFLGKLKGFGKKLGEYFEDLFKAFGDIFKAFKGSFWTGMATLWDRFKKGLSKLGNDLKDGIWKGLKNVAGWFTKQWAVVTKNFNRYTKRLVESINIAVDGVKEIASAASKFGKATVEAFKGLKDGKTFAKAFEDSAKYGGEFIQSIYDLAKLPYNKMLKFAKNFFKNIGLKFKDFKYRSAANTLLKSDKMKVLSNLDPEIKKITEDAIKDIKKLHGSDITTRLSKYSEDIGEIVKDSSKFDKEMANVADIIPGAGELIGFGVGASIDTYLLVDSGESFIKSVIVASVANALGGVVGGLLAMGGEALTVGGFGIVGVPLTIAAVLVDVGITETILRFFSKKYRGNKPLFGRDKSPTKEGNYLLNDTEYKKNFENSDALYLNNVMFTNSVLEKIVDNPEKMPRISGMNQAVHLDGEPITDDPTSEVEDNGNASQTNEENKKDRITMDIPYPGYLYVGFMNNVKKVVTKSTIENLKGKYNHYNDVLVDYIRQLSAKLNNLKSEYEGI